MKRRNFILRLYQKEHTIVNPIDENLEKIMCIFQPATLKVEEFFEHVSRTGEIPMNKIPEDW